MVLRQFQGNMEGGQGRNYGAWVVVDLAEMVHISSQELWFCMETDGANLFVSAYSVWS